eukprot:29436-Pelagococcus_subviridis.AAC.3
MSSIATCCRSFRGSGAAFAPPPPPSPPPLLTTPSTNDMISSSVMSSRMLLSVCLYTILPRALVFVPGFIPRALHDLPVEIPQLRTRPVRRAPVVVQPELERRARLRDRPDLDPAVAADEQLWTAVHVDPQPEIHAVQMRKLPLEQPVQRPDDVLLSRRLEDQTVALVAQLRDEIADELLRAGQRREVFRARGERLFTEVVRAALTRLEKEDVSRLDDVLADEPQPLRERSVDQPLAHERHHVIRQEASSLLPGRRVRVRVRVVTIRVTIRVRVTVRVHVVDHHLAVEQRRVMRRHPEPSQRRWKPHRDSPNVKLAIDQVRPVLHEQQHVPRPVRFPRHVVLPPLDDLHVIPRERHRLRPGEDGRVRVSAAEVRDDAFDLVRLVFVHGGPEDVVVVHGGAVQVAVGGGAEHIFAPPAGRSFPAAVSAAAGAWSVDDGLGARADVFVVIVAEEVARRDVRVLQRRRVD